MSAGVVQLVERLVANEKVVGSNPIARSTLRMADFVGHLTVRAVPAGLGRDARG